MQTQGSGTTALSLSEASKLCLSHLRAQRGMRALSRKLNDALRPARINFSQFCLLALLYRPHPPTVSELSDEMGMEKPHISAQVSQLIRRSLVISLQQDADRRQRRIVLTAHGRNVVAEALPLWHDASVETAAVVSRIDMASIASLYNFIEDQSNSELDMTDIGSFDILNRSDQQPF